MSEQMTSNIKYVHVRLPSRLNLASLTRVSMQLISFMTCFVLALIGLPGGLVLASSDDGDFRTNYAGYNDCVVLKNKETRVVLDPHCGGRVLEYSFNGRNSIYLDPAQDGWMYDPMKRQEIDPMGGRFDIGPERMIPVHPTLWLGAWKSEIIGPREVRMISRNDPATGTQLIRDFRLDEKTSRLICTQTMKNLLKDTMTWCYWGRTTAVGGGIVVMPLNPRSRFQKGYAVYESDYTINFLPMADPNVEVKDGFCVIRGPPAQPKFGFDSEDGWFAYLMPNNLMFVKNFTVYPDRIYNEMAAITTSLFYWKNQFCELEPIGPKEKISPGGSVSFTEEWRLLPYKFPLNRVELDLKGISTLASSKTVSDER